MAKLSAGNSVVRRVRIGRLAILAVPTLALGLVVGTGNSPVAAASTAPQLHVSGNQLVDQNGAVVTLRGVNRSGGEFSCVHGAGMWDGPMDQASVDAMKPWRINAVRVPLNEECWNGVYGSPGGSTYQNNVKSYVDLLNSNGFVAILDLHWTAGVYTGPNSACADQHASCQKPMPDAAQAVPFWTSVATMFRTNTSVIFDLFNEPWPEQATGSQAAWQCWRDGGTCTGIGYQVAGMQDLLDAVRSTGATNVVMVGGIEWSNDLRSWLTYRPSDPANNLVASHHSYNFNRCVSQACWDSELAPILAQVPLVVGEIGENDCAHGYIDALMNWLDAHDASYLGWTWNTWDCASGPALISDYSGTPTTFGQGLKAHFTTGGAPSSTSRFGFEGGTTQGWATSYGPVSVANSSLRAASGTRSLAVTLTGAGYPGISVTSNLGGLTPGAVVTAKIWAPSGSPRKAKAYAADGNWTLHQGPLMTLAAGAWTTLTFTVPSQQSVVALGLQFDNPTGWRGTYYVDSIEFPRSGFEDGTLNGWTVAWGAANLSLATTTARSFEGTRSMAASLTGGTSYSAMSVGTGLTGLTTGTVVTYRVFVPSTAPAGITFKPFATDNSWNTTFGGSQTVAYGSWQTVTFSWPIADGGKGVGLQVDNTPGWTGTVNVDAVRW